jgi:type IV pilus assembly protein PilM
MIEKPDETTTLGFEIEDGTLKFAKISLIKGSLTLENKGTVSYDLSSVKPLYNEEQQELLKKLSDKALTISTLDTSQVIVRPLEIHLKKEKDIQEVLNFQTEPLLPYPIENALIDYIKINPTEDGSLLSVFATKKEFIQNHLDKLVLLGVEPEVVSTVSIALMHFCQNFLPSDQSYYLAHIGLHQITCLLIQNGKLIAVQSSLLGIGDIKNEFHQDLSNLENDKPEVFEKWKILNIEIKKVIYSLSKQSKEESFNKIAFVGPGACFQTFIQSLIVENNWEQIEPRYDILENVSSEDLLNYSIPIGAALSGLPDSQDRINFRQNEFSYPYPWKRTKKPLMIYGALCLLLALAFFGFGQAYLSFKEDHLKSNYIELLSSINTSFNTFEADYESKISKTKVSEDQILSLNQLDAKDIANRTAFIEKEIQNTPDLFPLLPNVPKVSDVLAWLSTQHFQMGSPNKKDKIPPIQIENFSYNLVKRPEQNKKQEKYQVKVEIEFTSPTPKQAREFHDALIEPNDFIDPKGEVKWNTSKGLYRTSFYLKDKTIYPSPTSS